MRSSLPAGRVLRCCSAAALVLLGVQTTSCSATSRVGQAQVTEAGGQPCFAIPDEPETRAGPVRLFTLLVSERESESWRTLPAELWSFTFDPPGRSIEAKAQSCIRYGDLPASAKHRQPPKPLQPYRVYGVDINARPARDGATQGYKAEFCIKPAPDGRIAVQPVPWDASGQRWRYEVCAPRP